MQIDNGYPGGISPFIVDRDEHVFTQLPLSDNYFWRVYLAGHYSPECCPEYLVESNYEKLRDVSHRVTTNNATLTDFLKTQHESISRFVLLDLGAGPGENLERIGDAANRISHIHWVDLSPSLLRVARKRSQNSRWANRIKIHEADATDVGLPCGVADVVTMSYSLATIPVWFAAVESALRLLKPGGQLGLDGTTSIRAPIICRCCDGDSRHSISVNRREQFRIYR